MKVYRFKVTNTITEAPPPTSKFMSVSSVSIPGSKDSYSVLSFTEEHSVTQGVSLLGLVSVGVEQTYTWNFRTRTLSFPS